MIGMVLVTHGKLAEEMILAMEHVVGKQEMVEYVCIFPNDDIESKRKEVLEKATKVDTGKGVVLFTDMFGGTPSNLAISIIESANNEVIAGVNLPMLIKFARVRTKVSMEEAVNLAQESGRKYISVASRLLAQED
ncbi:MAG: PTS system mannose-specific EIIAB component [Alphaproteobacteria bacterium ADurb.Bin438]|nr:MAG: PTS system mannose-specific EIIAB component [Alphaproteobacteria bacterium ADurb.Bin438]